MPLSRGKQITTTESPFPTEPALTLLGNTQYALIAPGQDPSSVEWMSSDQAKAWLHSDAMPQTRRHKLLLECPVCKTHFTRSPSKLRDQVDTCKTLTHTCCVTCMGVMRTYLRTVDLSCDECGKQYKVGQAEHARRLVRGDKHHFCSYACSGKALSRTHRGEKHHNYNRVEMTCTHCEKKFLRTEGAAKKYRTMKPFCSRECYGTWLVGRATQKGTGRGGLRSYPPEFKAMRKKLLGPSALCVVCMYPAKDLHHKDENVENNAQGNLALVCRRCHTRHHAGPKHPLLSPSKE